MPPHFKNDPWRAFIGAGYTPQLDAGVSPFSWATKHEILPSFPPEAGKLQNLRPHSTARKGYNRREVEFVCHHKDAHVLLGYVCVMAWGGQGERACTGAHVKDAWDERETIQKHLSQLKAGGLTRSDAYNLFQNSGRVSGLGPAFFTKLLYFFDQTEAKKGNVKTKTGRCYIMDQWTARSVNLLTGQSLVKMAGTPPSISVSNANTGYDYERFCAQIDAIATSLQCHGSVVEERLFSWGGRRPGRWRHYVQRNG